MAEILIVHTGGSSSSSSSFHLPHSLFQFTSSHLITSIILTVRAGAGGGWCALFVFSQGSTCLLALRKNVYVCMYVHTDLYPYYILTLI